MNIRPALQYRRFLPASLTMLGSFVTMGCDQKLGGDVPATPEMQKKWQAEEKNQERQEQMTPSQPLSSAAQIHRDMPLQSLGGDVPAENHDSRED